MANTRHVALQVLRFCPLLNRAGPCILGVMGAYSTSLNGDTFYEIMNPSPFVVDAAQAIYGILNAVPRCK